MKSINPAEVAGTSSLEVLVMLEVRKLRREGRIDKINKEGRLRIMRATIWVQVKTNSSTQNRLNNNLTLNSDSEVAEEVVVATKKVTITEAKVVR
jgi:hypothetical protein